MYLKKGLKPVTGMPNSKFSYIVPGTYALHKQKVNKIFIIKYAPRS